MLFFELRCVSSDSTLLSAPCESIRVGDLLGELLDGCIAVIESAVHYMKIVDKQLRMAVVAFISVSTPFHSDEIVVLDPLSMKSQQRNLGTN